MPTAYATAADMAQAATGRWAELAQRAAPDEPGLDGPLLKASYEGGDRSDYSPALQAVADAALARLDEALVRASRHADTYLFPRYRAVMPLATSLVAGSDLPTVVATIALKRLYGTELPDDVRKGSQWADDYLTALAKGTVNLGVLDSQAAPAPGVVTSRTEPKRFDWAAY